MAVTSSLFYFFIAITVASLACGLFVVAGKVCGSTREGLRMKGFWHTRRRETSKAVRGNDDEEVRVAREGGPSVV